LHFITEGRDPCDIDPQESSAAAGTVAGSFESLHNRDTQALIKVEIYLSSYSYEECNSSILITDPLSVIAAGQCQSISAIALASFLTSNRRGSTF
jgi:hypothetical protein